MSDSSAFGFGKFIQGFDFLQNLGKSGASSSGLPPFSHWVAPTVSVEEIEKRIEELKAVQFWLEQNTKALAATVQALEVQKMTLSTLKSMNVNISEMAQAFPFAAAPAAAESAKSPLSDWPMSGAAKPAEAAPPPRTQAAPEVAPAPEAAARAQAPDAHSQAQPSANVGTAMQWWGALTQQFQQIAQQAMQDPAQQQAMLKATQMSTDFAKTAVKTASDLVRKTVAQAQPPQAATASPPKAAGEARTAAKTAKKSAPPKSAAAKKAVSADKKAPAATAKTVRAAAKKSAVRKPRAR